MEYQDDLIGTKQLFEDISKLADMSRIDAMIVDKPSDAEEIAPYYVDLYENGYPEDDEDLNPTRIGIPAYIIQKSDIIDRFESGGIVQVILTSSNRAIIVPYEIPRTTRFGTVLSAIDFNKPAHVAWDFPRFH